MTTLLRRHPVLATTDLDEARTSVGETFCPHGLTVTDRRGALSLVHRSLINNSEPTRPLC